MKKISGFLIMLLLIPTAGSAGQFDKEWDRCVSAIRSNYYAMGTRGKFIEDLFHKYAASARQASSREQFKKTVNEMIKETADSHFGLMLNTDQSFHTLNRLFRGRSPKIPFTGALLSEHPDGLKVDSVLADTSAEKAGLRRGDIIVAVNGNPFKAIKSLNKVEGKTKFSINRDGSNLQLEMEVKKRDLFDAIHEATQKSIRTREQNGKKIGYFRLWSMSDPRIQRLLIDSATATFAYTDGMILDMRDCIGGMADGYPDVFFRPAIVTERNSISSQDKRIYGYGKPVVVLANGGTVSAGEVFVYMMKASKRAKIVGSRTAGKLLTGNVARISSWSILLFPWKNVLLDGNRIGGTGIEPDFDVKLDYGPNGEDLVLQEGLRLLTIQ